MIDFSSFDTPDFDTTPAPADVPAGPARNTSGNLFLSALKSGTVGAAGSITGAAAAGAGALGFQDTANSLEATAKGLNAQAAGLGRSDIEDSSFLSSPGNFLRKGAYEITKGIPALIGAGAAGVAAGAALPEEVAAGVGAGAVSLAPKLFGTGVNVAKLGAGLIGGTGLFGAQSAGDLYNAAAAQPGGASQADAIKAIAMGVPLGAIQSIVPAHGAGSLFDHAAAQQATATVARTVRNEAVANAAAGAVGAGLQTAAQQTYDPNTGFADKAKGIVEAAVQGGAFGGLLGGAFGLLHGKFGGTENKAPVRNLSDDELQTATAGIDTSATAPTPNAPIAPQTLPGDAAPGAGRAPAFFPDAPQSDAASALAARYGGQPAQVPGQEALLQRFMAGYDTTPGLPQGVPVRAPDGTLLPGPSPTALRLADGRPAEAREGYVPTTPGGDPIPQPDFSERPYATQDSIALPDRSGLDTTKPNLPAVRLDLDRDPRAPIRDQTALSVEAFEQMRRTATELPEAPVVPHEIPDPAEAPVATTRLDASPQSLGPGEPDPVKVAERDEMMRKALFKTPEERAQIAALGDLYAPEVGAPRGDVSDVQLRQQVAEQSAIARDRRRIQAMFEGVDRRVSDEGVPHPSQVGADTPPPPVPSSPLSISDRVTNAAHELTGGTGGEAKIGDIRKALPDVASGDIDNALRQIHGDDSDSTLTQAPKGQRNGVDGVSVPGQGRFHALSVEARDNAQGDSGGLQERGAAPEALRDQPAGGGADGGADAGGAEAPRASADEAAPVRREGEAAQSTAEGPPAPAPGRVKLRLTSADTFGPIVDSAGNNAGTITRGRIYSKDAPFTIYRDGETRTANTMQEAQRAAQAMHDARVPAEPAPVAASEPKPARLSSQTPDPDRAKAQTILKMREAMRSTTGEPVVRNKSGPALKSKAMATAARRTEAQAARRDAREAAPVVDRAGQDRARLAEMEGRTDLSPQDRISRDTLAQKVADDTLEKLQAEKSADTGVRAERSRLSKLIEKSSLTDAERNEMQSIAARQERRLAEGTLGENLSSPQAPDGPPALPLPANTTPRALPMATFDREPRVSGYGAEQARADFKDITKGLKPEIASRVHLVDNASQLPAALVKSLRDQGFSDQQIASSMKGVYHNGEAYIRSDLAANRAQLEETFAHEVFGHLGNEYARSSKVNDANFGAMRQEGAMAKLFDDIGGTKRLLEIADKFGARQQLEQYTKFDYLKGGDAGLQTHQKAGLLDELISHATSDITTSGEKRALMEYVGAIKAKIADYLRAAGLTTMADRISRFDENDVAKWVADNRRAMTSDAPPPRTIDLASLGDERLRLVGMGVDRPVMPQMIHAQNEEAGSVTRAVGSIQAAMDHLPDISNQTRSAKSAFQAFRTGYGLVRSAPAILKAVLTTHYNLGREGNVIQGFVTQAHGIAGKALADLALSGKKGYAAAADVMKLMRESSGNNIDPKKTWEQHTWLTEGVDLKDPQAVARLEALRVKHDELNKLWHSLGQREGGAGQRAYDLSSNMQRGDLYAKRVMSMQTTHDIAFAKSDQLSGFDNNSGRDFKNNDAAKADPAAYEAYWKGEYEKRDAAMKAYAAAEGPRVAADRASQDAQIKEAIAKGRQPIPRSPVAGQTILEDVNYHLQANKQEMKKIDQGPYFHQGRTGDFFAAAHLATDADGNVAPETYKALMDALDKNNFGQYEINTLSNNAHVFIRVKTPYQSAQLFKVLAGLGEEHLDGTREPSRGTVGDESSYKTGDIPTLDRALADVEAKNPKTGNAEQDKVRDQMVRDQRAALIDLLPDSSLRLVSEQRSNVQGYSRDQLNNNMRRGQITARAIGQGAIRSEMLDATARIAAIKQEVKKSDPLNSVSIGDHADAYMSRAAANSVRTSDGLVNQARSLAHSYYLAASPAYVMLNLSQLPTLTLPELGRKYGFAKSFAAMSSAGADAAKVIAAVVRSGHADTAAITEEVLAKAGISERQKDLIRQLERSGDLETGGYSRSMGGQADRVSQSKVSRALDFANGTATLSELTGRLVSAFAADKLHAADPKRSGFATPHEYAGHVLSESQFNWGSFDTPRMFSAGGPLGQAGPLVFQFHGFQSRLFEKVYDEAKNGFITRGEGAAESRAFMYQHMAALTFLAGSLGLPAAGWTAAAATRLSGQFNGGEGYDVQAHYRDFLASMLGKDVGEIVARGLPRYLGVDMSEAGDKILPLQGLLEDHRALKDAITSQLAQSWGSSPGIAVNAATSMQLVAQGRIGEALAHVLPSTLRNGVKAYRLSEYGYENSKGERIPMSVSAGDVLKKALGFTPGVEAEEDDKEEVERNATEDRKAKAGVIKQQLAIAMERHDADGVAKWSAEVRAYDADPAHRGQPIGPSIGPYLAQRAQAVAYARQSGLPVGTKPTDLNARRLIQF